MFKSKQTPEVRQVYIASPSGGFMTRAPTNQNTPGFSVCGVCQCCTCISLGVLTTPTGVIKCILLLLGVISHLLALQYGLEYAEKLGLGYTLFLSVNSGSILTTFVLLICYISSTPTYNKVRPSLFEVIFSGICSCLYIGSSSLLATSVYSHLYYFYLSIPGFSAYPALTAVYVLGFVNGILYGVDSTMALKFMRSLR